MKRKVVAILLASILSVSASSFIFASNINNSIQHKTNQRGFTFTEIKTDDIWTIQFDDDSYVWNILESSKKHNVYPDSLRDSIVNNYGANRFSPYQDVIRIQELDASSEIIEYSENGVTRTESQQSNQDASAYVAPSGALTASGKEVKVGMAAMHTNVTTKTGETTSTIVKLGETIYFGTSKNPAEINYNGYKTKSLVVEDRGAPTNRSKYWIDIFFGVNTDANKTAADLYGVQSAQYYWNYN